MIKINSFHLRWKVLTGRLVFAVFAAATFIVSGFFVPLVTQADPTPTTLTIISPNGGEKWRGTQEIIWDFTGGNEGDKISLVYTTNDFVTQSLIVEDIPLESGSYLWDTATVSDNANYKVKVISETGIVFDPSDAVFTVDNTDPETSFAIDPADPDGDNGWYISVPEITLTCDDNLSGCGDTTFYSWNDDSDPDSFTEYEGPITPPGDGEHTLFYYSEDEAIDKDGDNNREDVQASATIKVDTVFPFVDFYTLDGATADAFFNPNAPDDVVIFIDASEPVKFNIIRILNDEGDTVKSFAQTGSFQETVTKTWNGKDTGGTVVPDGTYTVRIDIKDVAGNETEDIDLEPYDITVDTQDPGIDDFDDPDDDTVYRDEEGDIPLEFTPSDPDPGTPLECGYKLDGGDFVSLGECESGGIFEGSIEIDGLSDGRHSVVAAVLDSAGNEGVSDPVSFVFDDDETLTVDDDGIEFADFDNIPDALDETIAGDTISVADGEYDGNIDVEESVTLQGTGFDDTTIIEVDEYGFRVLTDGVTIDGFSFEGDGEGIGVLIDDSEEALDGIVISNNGFFDLDFGVFFESCCSGAEHITVTAGAPGGTVFEGINESAVWLENGGGGVFTVKNASISDVDGDGIFIAGANEAYVLDNDLSDIGGNGFRISEVEGGDILEISGNTITVDGNGTYIGGDEDTVEYETITISGNTLDENGEYGLYIGGEESDVEFTTLSITGNVVTDNDGNGIYIQNIGGVEFEEVEAIISGNTITGNGFQNGGSGIYIYYVYDSILTISGNPAISENAENGVYIYEIYDGGDVAISENVINGNGEAGIRVDEISDSELSVFGNTITNNEGDLSGIHINDVEESTVTINQNSITGNGTGLFVGESDDEIDATDNWWGTINGPEHPDNTFNVGEQGDEVDDNGGDAEIDFVPWLDAAPPEGNSFAPVTTNDPEGSDYSSIQAAVDAVDVDGTVTAVAGVFTESGIEATTEGISILGEEGVIVRSPGECPSLTPSAVFHLHGDDITLSGFEIDADGQCENGVHIGDLEEITVSGVEVSGNEIYGATYGVTLSWGSSDDSESPNVVSDNDVHNNDTGVLIDSAHWNLIEDNLIHENDSEGILIGNCIQDFGGCPGGAPSNNTITGNTIEDNGEDDTGIVIDGSGIGDGNSANFNKITGNVFGVANDTETVFDAKKNWWGSFRGPFHDDTNLLGEGDEISDFVDFSPWCRTSDLEECEEGEAIDVLGSIGPLDELLLSFDPNPVAIPNASELTVKAVDEVGALLVNDTREIELNAGGTTKFDGIAGPALIDLEDGVLMVDVTDSIPGTVNVVAKDSGVPKGSATVTFTGDETAPTIVSHTPADNAIDVSVEVVPYLTFSEPLKASTVNSANIQLKKYSDDSVVPATVSLVEGGTQMNIDPTGLLEFETQYYFAVSTSVKDEAGNALATALDAGTKADHEFTTEELAGIVLDDIVLPSAGEANNTYLDGWHYIFKITVNDPAETDLFVKFTDWVNTADDEETVPVFDNTRLLLNAGAGVGLTEDDIEEGFSLGNDYEDQMLDGIPTAVDISNVDNNLDKAGRQVQFDVFVKIPGDTAPGFYTTEFGILTETPEP